MPGSEGGDLSERRIMALEQQVEADRRRIAVLEDTVMQLARTVGLPNVRVDHHPSIVMVEAVTSVPTFQARPTAGPEATPIPGADVTVIPRAVAAAQRRTRPVDRDTNDLFAQLSALTAEPQQQPPPTCGAPRKVEIAGLIPTAEQSTILEAYEGGGSFKVSAFAGTGKSSSLRMIGAKMNGRRGLYMSFNNAIVKEAKQLFPSSVECRTAHSLAYAALGMRRYHDRKLRGKLYPEQVARILGLSDMDGMSRHVIASFLQQTVATFCQSPDKQLGPKHLAFAFPNGQRSQLNQNLLRYAQDLWELVSDLDNEVPATHDVYLKRWHLNGPTLPYDTLLLDEGQDLNGIMLALAAAFGGQKVLVGDTYQQLYAWRGALNAMEKVQAPELYLSQSWRFGEAVAVIANAILAHRDTPPAVTIRGNPNRETLVLSEGEPTEPFSYIARTNGDLFTYALSKIGRRRMHVVGGAAEMIETLTSAHALSEADMPNVKAPNIARFKSWEALTKMAADVDDAELRFVQRVVDTHGRTLPGLLEQLRGSLVEREDQAEIVLSTGHRSKGRQFKHVVLGDDFKHPAELAAKRRALSAAGQQVPADVQQSEAEEINVLYVAATRAIRSLRVNSAIETGI